MKTTTLYFKIKNLLIGVIGTIVVHSCGSFQGASYFDSDGIYSSQSRNQIEKSTEKANSNYYSQYFKNAAESGYTDPNAEELYFTDTDTYASSPEETYSNTTSTAQIPWGDQPNQTEIIMFDSRPNYLWGLSGFAFNFSPYWSSFYTNPYRFGYGRFYSPFYNYPYFNPYRGHAGFWDPFDAFYSLFSYYGGFYSPYYGYGYGYRNHWSNRYRRWNRFDDFYGNEYRRSNSRDYQTTVARVKSSRGEKTNPRSNERSRVESKRRNQKDHEIQSAISRLNVGRGVNSLGRTTLSGYDRSRFGETQNRLGNSNISRSTVSSNIRSNGVRLGNTNITKSNTGSLRSSGRLSYPSNRLERNPNASSSEQKRSNRFIPSTRFRVNSSSNYRAQAGSNPSRNTLRSTSNNSQQRANYTRNNNTTNSSRSYSRPSGSGSSSRPSFSSGSSSRSSSSSGRSSSSSKSGRRNK